ncbi:hypothetical protein ACKKBG_A18810 [Auxenochlorella protothecoides x Auxenochlorella symbiontica]|uniref:Transcription initiation factor IIA subunit 1 n=2 Tax=Auxenochlorella protothecoides TaxID=3075 RepID=A0A087SC72_AUXPR|nr:Transcription initiation factor IIA subunit 1 [Auxenochlorella protothecoides]KFM23326.1 Transcription initiation factor IIA subunit 1 [Auxenochlorella protothecoides]
MSRAGGEKAGRPGVGEATLGVYQGVIDDVVANVKADFVQEGVDEAVLDELRSLWESHIVKLGVLGKANDPSGKQSKEGVRAADALTLSEDASVLAARPTKDQSPGPGAAALDHGDRKRPIIETGDTPPTKLVKTEAIQTPSIPQWDGAAEEAAGVSDPSSSVPAGAEAEAEDNLDDVELDDDELNEDDDLEDVDAVGSDSEDQLLGQFDKVHRSKARWKVNLRHCILQLDGRDYLLHKATGEFNF